jgi:hypothetical protein
MLDVGLVARIEKSSSMAELFSVLRTFPSIGDFLAMQFATDLNYSTIVDFDEMTFVVAGPGAIRGLKKCFTSWGDYSEAEIIRWTCERQVTEFRRLGLQPVTLQGRALQLIDCQNVFCEVDKYTRASNPEVAVDRTRIKQRFRPSGDPVTLVLPKKWASCPSHRSAPAQQNRSGSRGRLASASELFAWSSEHCASRRGRWGGCGRGLS